jgi:uncharacterized membrane protein
MAILIAILTQRERGRQRRHQVLRHSLRLADRPGNGQNWLMQQALTLSGGLSLATLFGMIGVALAMAYRLYKGQAMSLLAAWWTIPVISLFGLGVALYLAISEANPCPTCEAWPYGRFFSLIPVGLASVLGYLLLLAAWGLSLFSSDRLQTIAPYAVFAVASARLLLAIYLIVLDPFALSATCPWCLVSATLTTITFWLSAEVLLSLRLYW